MELAVLRIQVLKPLNQEPPINNDVLCHMKFKMSEVFNCPTDLYTGTGKPCAGQSNAKLWSDFASSPCILSTEGNFGTALPTGSMEWN